MQYRKYLDQLQERLVRVAEVLSPGLRPGTWECNGVEKRHILPLAEVKGSAALRAEAIAAHLHFDVAEVLPGLRGLHRDIHHLNSSQLLCLMFFGEFLKRGADGMTLLKDFVSNAFGIRLCGVVKYGFEYRQKDARYYFNIQGRRRYEGTSFDFHIADERGTEIFFETKFSENGFGRCPKNDGCYQLKAQEYIKLLPADVEVSCEEFLERYQILRNVIRATGANKYVVFITDGDNPATNAEISGIPHSNNIRHYTWQQLAAHYPFELPFQFKAMLD